MKEQHELDRLLKNKFDAREFEFQEAYWEEAAGLIAAAEAGEKKPFGFWWRWLVADSTLVLALLMAIFLFPIQTTDYVSPLLTENNNLSETKTPQPTQNQIDTLTSLTQKLEQTPTDSQNKSEATANTSSPLIAEKTISPKSTSQKQNPVSGSISSSLLNEDNSDIFNSSLAIAESDNTDSHFSKETGTELSLRNAELNTLDHLLDTIRAEGISPDERLLPAFLNQEKISKHNLGLVVGLQSSKSFDNSEGKRLTHWPTIGVKYTYAPNSRFRLQSGLMLENRSALSLNKSFTSTQFGFGRNEETTMLQPQSTHFLALPLQLGYRFQKRHSFSLGVNTAFLLDIRSSLTTHTTDALGNLTTETENAWGYRQGLHRFDAGLLLGYQFQFSPKMGLMLEAYQGFRDISDNEFWEMVRVDKQRQVRVKVYWNLF